MRVVVKKVKTMNMKRMMIGFLVVMILVLIGCVVEIIDDGFRFYIDVKVKVGKVDQWNNWNNPERFCVELEYKLEVFFKEGYSEYIPWLDIYWFMYKDGINDRW